MKKIIYLSLILMIFLVGCSNTSEDVQKILDSGQVTGSIYKNDFFGMSIWIPEHWYVATEEDLIELTEAGNDFIAGEDEDLRDILEKADLKTAYLLVIDNNNMANNANLIVIAEKLSFFDGIRDGAAYLDIVREGLEEMLQEIPYEFEKDPYTKMIGGKLFHVLETSADFYDLKLIQKYHVSIMNGYALSFISTSLDDAQNLEELSNIVGIIEFKD